MQHLEANRRAAAVTGEQRGGRRQPTAGARPDQGHPLGVDAERSRLGVQTYRQRGVAVVHAPPDRAARGPGGTRPTRRRRRCRRPPWPRPACSASMLPIDEAAAVDHDDARRPCPAVAASGRYIRTGTSGSPSQPGTVRSSIVQRLDARAISIADRGEHRVEARRGRRPGRRGRSPAARRPAPPARGRSSLYLPRSSWPTSAACGCRRRCGSTRRSCTSWPAARRPVWRTRRRSPSRCGKSTSWASLLLKASEPSPAP